MHLVAAPDKFRGTIEASEAAAAMAVAAEAVGWTVDLAPLSDGGEGFGAVLNGTASVVSVHGPLGEPVRARFWVLEDPTIAVVEMAEAAGRSLLLDPSPAEAFAASTTGVGELILAAIGAGATTIIVGCGGSAAILNGGGIGEVALIAATDVTTTFTAAARVFGPQKGADAPTVLRMEQRLESCAARLDELAGRPVTTAPRSGAAGGLAGALMALGARSASGVDVIATLIKLEQRLAQADLVLTGEGSLDATTLEGKVVTWLVDRTPPSARLAVIAGSVEPGIAAALTRRRGHTVDVLSLTKLVGADRAHHDTRTAIIEAVTTLLG